MDYILIFLTGFFGSMHCVGMCGAIVAAYSTQDNFHDKNAAGKWNPFLKHLSYNFGRVLSYVFVGGLLGAIGGGFSGLQSAGEWFSTAAGVLLLLSGIWMMRIFPWMGFKREISFPSGKKSFLVIFNENIRRIALIAYRREQVLHRIADPAPAVRIIYSMFVAAAASGSAVNGAVTMALFGSALFRRLSLSDLYRRSSVFDYECGEINLQR